MANWSLYLLRDETNSLYTGITTDVERRLSEHRENSRYGAKYTRSRKQLELVYSCELGELALVPRGVYRGKRVL